MTVVSAVSTRARQARRTGSNPVGHSHAVLAQLVEAQVLDTWRSGFESPGRYSRRANRHLHLPLAATQPVDGAALIQRYRQVRSLGARPGRIPSLL